MLKKTAYLITLIIFGIIIFMAIVIDRNDPQDQVLYRGADAQKPTYEQATPEAIFSEELGN